jgi:vacuolar-type H+-ATPase catalytic subunit A/Vma1
LKAVPVVTIKKELKELSNEELTELCLRLSKFKKENKELLTYLLFESQNEEDYILSIKNFVDEQFEIINRDSYFYIKKSVRKILRLIKKFARYSLKKETEVELLLYFCQKLKEFSPSIKNNVTLTNIFERQLLLAKKIISTLHEDLQYDYNLVIDELND